MSTHEITTPKSKTVVVLKDDITGRDEEAIQAIAENGFAMEARSDGSASGKVEGSLVSQMRHKALEIVIVSVNGKTDDVVNAVLDLPRADYQAVVAAVNAVTDPVEGQEKKD